VLERFRSHLQDSGLIPQGARVLVGYSGGADSTALLHLLFICGVDVVAAHLHHGQRDEADTELKLCEAFCQELGVPFMAGRADVPLIAQNIKIGLEEAGRHARYEFFRQASIGTQCRLVATAHTLDDHVETVLLNLARGSGLSGLGGIGAQRENIIRPLLPFSRAETREYCHDHGFWFHDDPANTDLNFSRARIRHRVVPEMLVVNSSFMTAVERLASTASEENAFLNSMAAAALEGCEVPVNGALRFLTLDCEVWLDRAKLMHLPPVLQKRGLRLAAGALGASLDFDQTVAAVTGLAATEKGSVTAEGGQVVVEWDPSHLVARVLNPAQAFRFNLTVPGETFSEEFGWVFTVVPCDASDFRRDRGSLDVVIDASAVKGQLHFRSAKAGDEMSPLGMTGTRKLADMMAECGLTAAARKCLPIVCDMVGPVWAPGVAIADRVKIASSKETALQLRFGPQA
jgi:tRNA(Ile)-lysidine synthase